MKVKDLQQLLAQYQGEAEIKVYDRSRPRMPEIDIDFITTIDCGSYVGVVINSPDDSFPCNCGGRFHPVEGEGYVCDKCDLTRIFKPT